MTTQTSFQEKKYALHPILVKILNMESALQEVELSQAPIKKQMKALSTLCALSEGYDNIKPAQFSSICFYKIGRQLKIYKHKTNRQKNRENVKVRAWKHHIPFTSRKNSHSQYSKSQKSLD